MSSPTWSSVSSYVRLTSAPKLSESPPATAMAEALEDEPSLELEEQDLLEPLAIAYAPMLRSTLFPVLARASVVDSHGWGVPPLARRLAA